MANNIEAAVFGGACDVVPWKDACKAQPVFDKASRSYKQVVEIAANSSQPLEAYTITSGQAKGYRVLLLAPASKLGLFGLPIELREIIYAHVLVNPLIVELKFFDPSPGKHRIVQKSFPDHTARYPDPSKDWDRHQGKWKTRGRNAISLLLLNKEITAEALKILHGANTFRIDCTRLLEHFLTELTGRGQVQHLRHMQIGKNTISVGTLQEMLTTVELAPNLRTIQVSLPRTWIKAPKKLLRACEPLLQKAQGQGRGGMISRQIEHFVSEIACTCAGCKFRVGDELVDTARQCSDYRKIAARLSQCKKTAARVAEDEKFWKDFSDLVKAKYGTRAAGSATSA
ncbi:unnamed protein product [Zymoseptoria tritici ST99CH_1A5]|uniref:DUF7730 domain-containing protein n=3 Tax=Zymoseptoria tritici TaxID=1047171 RepID=F9XL61_ZYMTI|nr:uncharacterized protein MYCGRDRAFT_96244 [Zymoseptoria tritici IPO323]EGP83863.1 hypothetical protein MYCGRDRAFT_96244 [Zymoseptoria tritici IPO323]SMQ54723.1 unnamed protein product [Zymoseptoria tritici ST99CH_3D7]SMY28373.1 unnamed protein product [Zymoseptoria tritici ST99CH_1A5]